MKSALMSTAGAAWGNSARTQEASVLLEGAGLVNVQAADSPLIFTEPGSLSFGDMNLLAGVTSKQLLLSVRDAGGGAGTWTVELQPQSASAGATLELPLHRRAWRLGRRPGHGARGAAAPRATTTASWCCAAA